MENLNHLESLVLMFLEAHPGKDFAISRKTLVEKVNGDAPLIFQVNEREVRMTIKHLVESHGQWIGSCTKGYFMIQTDEELLSTCKYYHGYALSLLHVEAKLRKTTLAALLGQLSIEFGKGPNSGYPDVAP